MHYPVVPIFVSSYSFKSILTFNVKSIEGGPDSIVEIVKQEKIDPVYVMDDNFAGFLDAHENLKDVAQLVFGLRINFCNSLREPPEESLKSLCKLSVFIKNMAGYYDLMKLYNYLNKNCFVGKMVCGDYEILRKFWTNNLLLAVPFYNSFIHRNTCYSSNCVPDFGNIVPSFFHEDNTLFFDEIIQNGILQYAGEKFPVINTQTIYYKERKDFLAWQAYRCIQKRTVIKQPEMEHCHSNNFCVEAWREKCGK